MSPPPRSAPAAGICSRLSSHAPCGLTDTVITITDMRNRNHNYTFGDIKNFKNSLSYEKFCFKVCANTFNKISIEVTTLISKADYFLYDFNNHDLFNKDIQSEITLINEIKNHKNFKTITLGHFMPTMDYEI